MQLVNYLYVLYGTSNDTNIEKLLHSFDSLQEKYQVAKIMNGAMRGVPPRKSQIGYENLKYTPAFDHRNVCNVRHVHCKIDLYLQFNCIDKKKMHVIIVVSVGLEIKQIFQIFGQ